MTTPTENTKFDKVMKWIPDRKAVAGGLAGVFSFFVLAAQPELDPEMVTGLIAAIMGFVFYIVPPSKSDILRRADETLKALGDKNDGEAKVIIESKK